MIAALLHHLTVDALPLLAQSSSGDASWILLLGPAGGGATYFGIYRYYRNVHKTHAFEHETRISAQPITGDDLKVREIKGTRQSRIDGDNRYDHRQRVQRG